MRRNCGYCITCLERWLYCGRERLGRRRLPQRFPCWRTRQSGWPWALLWGRRGGGAAPEAQRGPQLRQLLHQQLQLIPLEASADSLVPLEALLREVLEAPLGEVWRLPLRQHLQAVSNRKVEYAGGGPTYPYLLRG